MKRIIACALAAFLVSACQEEEAKPSEGSEAETTQSTEPEQVESTEDTATADDGDGAVADAPEETLSEPSDSQDAASISDVSQDAIDGCIDVLREQEGSVGGTVQSTEFSEANSLVILQDQNENTWRCLTSNDGSGATVEAEEGAAGTDEPSSEDSATADDGQGAMDGSAMPSVGSPTDVTAFEGAKAGQAPGGLAALGFESIRTEGLTTFWFNRETGACARITTSEGVYSEVVMLAAEDC